ncbi:MAG: bifunctional riboflavin kinase/FMN adenylyltransferase [Bacteroidales bacterium]|nr:bifunctional riboflavin kinase/FMN adenylyltransferase [Bacteroidales bacterium]
MAVIATGFFDGVHSGHRLVIDTLLSEARARGEESVVVTFWPHPRVTLQKDAESLKLLTSRPVKEAMLRRMGVDRLETIEFSMDFASLSALDYIRMLRDGYGCTTLVLGYDTRFGSEQLGPQAIADLALSEGLASVIVPPVCAPDSSAPISSTLIRAALEEGDTLLAASYLGRPYSIEGTVVSGNHLGRTLGFPTANMAIEEPLLLIPRSGVYSSTVFMKQCFREEQSIQKALPPVAWNGRGPRSGRGSEATLSEWTAPEENVVSFKAMTNVGTRPTVGGSDKLTVETHLFDFDREIYGERITVCFHERIRDERRFPSLDALRAQLRADAAIIRG